MLIKTAAGNTGRDNRNVNGFMKNIDCEKNYDEENKIFRTNFCLIREMKFS